MDFTSIHEIQATTHADRLAGRIDAARRLADAGGDADAARAAGEAFEKLFAALLVREMSSTLQDGFFGEGPGTDTFNGWLEEHLGAALAADGALGIAEAVRASILRKEAAIAAEEARP